MQKLLHMLSFGLVLKLCLLSFLQAQEQPPFFYGRVDAEWIEMDRYGPFSTADAVILHDFGMASIELNRQSPAVRYIYHRRIKIQSREGLKYARIEIPIERKEWDENLIEIRAATYNLNGEGDVVQFPIPRRKLRQRKVNKNLLVIELEFPFVKVGSVIEYIYQIRSGKLDKLRPWKFQQEIPVRLSEYQTLIPQTYDYLPVISGNRSSIQTYSQGYRRNFNRTESFYLPQYYGSYEWRSAVPLRNYASISGNVQVYLMENVDIAKEESFSLGKESYSPTISLQLEKDFLTNRSNQNLFSDWEQLNRQVSKRFRMRRIKADKKEMYRIAQQTIRKNPAPSRVVSALVDRTRNDLKWSGEYGIKPNRLDRALKAGEGTGVDINLRLMHLLRAAGLEAWPVLISTIDHGRLTPLYPVIDQFNHLIVSVLLNGEEILLDGTEEVSRLGILPKNDLNQVGFRLDDEGGQWIKLHSRNRVNQVTYSRFDLDEKGQLKGDISVQNRDYSIILEQDKLDDANEKALEYLREHVLIGMSNPDISNQSVSGLADDEEMLVVNCELTTEDFVEVAGDHMIIQPMMIKMVAQNPFQREERITPVDFPYPMSDSHMLGLRIPEGYSIAQLPKPIRVILPNNAGAFTYNVLEMGNIVHFTSSIQINKTTFMPEEYEGIRSFFEFVVRKHQEDIILRKIQ